MRTRLAGAAVVLVALTGCAGAFRATIDGARVDVSPAECAPLWAAASAELQDRGFRIEAYYPLTGVMRTATRVMPGTAPCGIGSCGYRDTVWVTVDPRGEVRVNIARELAMPAYMATPGAGAGGFYYTSWQPPAPTQRDTVGGVLANQQALLWAILTRANGQRGGGATVAEPPAPGASPSAPGPGREAASGPAATGAAAPATPAVVPAPAADAAVPATGADPAR